MVMMPIPLDLLGPINATRDSSNTKLERKHRFLDKLRPAANVRLLPTHDCQPAHDPVAVIQRCNDPEIQTKAGIVNEIPGGRVTKKGIVN
jgi:hypothetical protein